MATTGAKPSTTGLPETVQRQIRDARGMIRRRLRPQSDAEPLYALIPPQRVARGTTTLSSLAD